jgi:hypothetical protein
MICSQSAASLVASVCMLLAALLLCMDSAGQTHSVHRWLLDHGESAQCACLRSRVELCSNGNGMLTERGADSLRADAPLRPLLDTHTQRELLAANQPREQSAAPPAKGALLWQQLLLTACGADSLQAPVPAYEERTTGCLEHLLLTLLAIFFIASHAAEA